MGSRRFYSDIRFEWGWNSSEPLSNKKNATFNTPFRLLNKYKKIEKYTLIKLHDPTANMNTKPAHSVESLWNDN